MNKKRIISYVMAAALLVGGTFAGTKALFTDEVSAAGEISISTGDVDIAAEATQDWKLVRNGVENENSTDVLINEFDNLKTGDVLTKQVTVTNAGTLVAIVDLLENTDITGLLPEGIDYSAEVSLNKGAVEREDGKIAMTPKSSLVVDLKIEVNGGGQHNTEGSLNSDEQDSKFINLKDSYTLTATQQNPNGAK